MKFLKYLFTALIICALAAALLCAVYKMFPLRCVEEIRSESAARGVDPYLTAALIKAESNFDPFALSNAGAKGLMQLTDETALFCAEKLGFTLGEGDIYDPEVNIRLGVYYLSRLLEIFGDEDLAAAAYNAGEGRVREWLNDPTYSTDGEKLDSIPYGETERHVEKIALYKKVYKILYPNL